LLIGSDCRRIIIGSNSSFTDLYSASRSKVVGIWRDEQQDESGQRQRNDGRPRTADGRWKTRDK
jgi:hypothetical protein